MHRIVYRTKNRLLARLLKKAGIHIPAFSSSKTSDSDGFCLDRNQPLTAYLAYNSIFTYALYTEQSNRRARSNARIDPGGRIPEARKSPPKTVFGGLAGNLWAETKSGMGTKL